MKFFSFFMAVFLMNQNVFASEFLSDENKVKLEKLYLQKLDKWVSDGGDVNSVQEQVITNCGKLFYMHVDPERIPNLSVDAREGYDQLIDICSKITVNRVHPQPEFEDPKTVKLVCIDIAADHPVIGKLCQKANLQY